MAITLNPGAGSITIESPSYPYQPGDNYPLVVGKTFGGGHKVADLGSGTDWQRFVLRFDDMGQTDYNSLRTFLLTTVNWSQTVFTYTDPFSVAHTNVRYISGFEGFQLNDYQRWQGTLILEKDMSL